uniref:Aberrant lateral root formation 4 n=1 Tax=Gongylonema pulchrum TaxID=637853 RepID=A0A183E7R7_9BILA
LIEKTLKEAAAAESETVAAKTIQTCYDIIDRYIVTAPHIHEVAISSVPLVAVFIGLDDVSRHEQCRKCLDGCMMQLEKISGIWKKVLSKTVYVKCMGDIISHLFTVLIKLVLSMEDIRANDAELCALALSKVLKECELLVDRSGHSPINKKVELEFCRMHEVVFCLEASLQCA